MPSLLQSLLSSSSMAAVCVGAEGLREQQLVNSTVDSVHAWTQQGLSSLLKDWLDANAPPPGLSWPVASDLEDLMPVPQGAEVQLFLSCAVPVVLPRTS